MERNTGDEVDRHQLGISTPALMYKVLPQSYQDVDIICMMVVCFDVVSDRLDTAISDTTVRSCHLIGSRYDSINTIIPE